MYLAAINRGSEMGFIDNMKLRGVFDPNVASEGGMSGMPTQHPLKVALNALKPFMMDMANRNLQDMQYTNQIRNGNGRMQQTFDPRAGMDSQGAAPPLAPQNVVFNPGPAPNTEYSRAMSGEGEKMSLAKQQLVSQDADRRADNIRADKADRRADAQLGLDREGLQLDKLKNSQIYDTKTRDLEDKARIAEQKLALAQEVANNRQVSGQEQMEIRRLQLEAQGMRHAADLAIKDLQLLESQRNNDMRDAVARDAAGRGEYSETITTLNADGTERRAVTRRGQDAQTPNAANPVTPPTKTPVNRSSPPPKVPGYDWVRKPDNSGWTAVPGK